MEGNLQGTEHCSQERVKTNSDMLQSVSQLSQHNGTTVHVMAAVGPHVAACAASLDEVSSAVSPYLVRFISLPLQLNHIRLLR